MSTAKFSHGALALRFGELSARDIDLVQAGWQLSITDRRERIATAVLSGYAAADVADGVLAARSAVAWADFLITELDGKPDAEG